MCWIGRRANKRKAMHDTIVYKVLNVYRLDENVLMSPRQHFQYEVGRTYNVKIFPMGINRYSFDMIKIVHGIHCYSGKCTFDRMLDGGDPFDSQLKRYCSIHANLIQNLADFDSGAIHVYRQDTFYFPMVFECIIPKGTTYYVNKAGEIATEALTIKKAITDL